MEQDIQAEIILDNEANEERTARFGPYNPYCMRCTGLVRMKKRAPHLWGCACGAVCDLRDYAAQREEHRALEAAAAGRLTDVEREFYFEPGGGDA